MYGNLATAYKARPSARPRSATATRGRPSKPSSCRSRRSPTSPTSAQIPPETPELAVFVAGRLWTRVDPSSGTDRARRSTSCARTPTARAGCSSATARPARGCPRASTTSSPSSAPARRLRAAQAAEPRRRRQAAQPARQHRRCPASSTGGEPPETSTTRVTQRPGRCRAWAASVSIRDYETETLAIAGVTSSARMGPASTTSPRSCAPC